MALVLATLALLMGGCDQRRADIPTAALRERLSTTTAANEALYQEVLTRMQRRLEEDLKDGRPTCINLLTLSGGSEGGAFGAGFLHAWSQLPATDPHAMPQFDLVTGISTGALIAPYALLGDTADLAQVDDLYRSSQAAYVSSRIWSFLSSKRAYYDISGLEAVIRADLATTVIPGLAQLPDPNRSVVTASADLDIGLLHLWDLRQQASSLDRLFAVQRAAIAIPGAFDPVEIDGALQVDAGVLMQFIAVANPEAIGSVMRSWNAAHPDHPASLRQWIIINAASHAPLQTVQPGWVDCLPRSVAMLIKSGVIGPLTSIMLQSDLLRSQGLDVETRWVSIPAELVIDPRLPPFDNRITVPLSDLGRRLGARQQCWNTTRPRFTGRELSEPDLVPVSATGP